MTAPALHPCEPWAIDQEIDNIEGLGAEDRARVIQAATEVVWALSGRRFGVCTVTVRPCRSMAIERARREIIMWPWLAPYGGFGYFPSVPYRLDGVWSNAWPMCACTDGCSCKPTAQLRLPRRPVCSVDEVKIDGVVLDSSAYRVDDFQWLVRLDGLNWLLDQNLDLDDDQPGTWSIRWHYGRPVPAMGNIAVRVLAQELMKALAKQPCDLPQRVTNIVYENATVAMLDPQLYLEQGRTGLYMVDLFIKSVNPNGRQRQGGIYRADAPPRAGRRTNT